MRPRRLNPRTLVAMAHDIIVAAAVWAFTFALRWNFELAPGTWELLLQTLPTIVAIEFACFAYFGLYRGIWRFASMHDLRLIALAVGVSSLIVPIVLLLWKFGLGVPRTMYFLNPLLLLLFMSIGRLAYRWFKERQGLARAQDQPQPVLILGAGADALSLIDQLDRSPQWVVAGLLDDNRNRIGRNINGRPVLGTSRDIGQVARDTHCRHAILAMRSADNVERHRLFELCNRANVKLLVVPGLSDLMSGRVSVSQLRHVDVDDLLGRDPVQMDTTGMRFLLEGQSVLVTGAGGSIGRELCIQIAGFRPERLLLYELNEYGLYEIDEFLKLRHPQVRTVPLIGDVKDRERLAEVFREHSPTVVYHAAAYKHVPMLEERNAWQAVRNNTLGTRVIAEVAARFDVTRFVFVSTDKAVNPTNVMGATKRMAEMILQHRHRRDGLPVVSVRFGNVLGSSGSVIPRFREQIARGGPITVTHPDITRYFMSIPEATQLVLQAGLMGRGGEVFVLDMGEPIRIVDLARTMVRLCGLEETAIPIEFTGLRPGEKLYEELLADNEKTLATPHPKLRVSRAIEPPGHIWDERCCAWIESQEPQSDEIVRERLRNFVPEYQPTPGDEASQPEFIGART